MMRAILALFVVVPLAFGAVALGLKHMEQVGRDCATIGARTGRVTQHDGLRCFVRYGGGWARVALVPE